MAPSISGPVYPTGLLSAKGDPFPGGSMNFQGEVPRGPAWMTCRLLQPGHANALVYQTGVPPLMPKAPSGP